MPEERDLVRAAAGGDREAFNGLVRLHQAGLRALVAMSLLPPDDVNDIVQDAFIDAYRHLDRFDPEREFGPWIRGICRHRLQKFLRDRAVRRRREVAAVDVALAEAPLPDESAAEAALRRVMALRHCLAELRADHRQVLTLRFHDGVAVQDIAQQLSKSANSVSVLILHLKNLLQHCVAGRVRMEP